MIEVKNVTKYYNSEAKAVDNLTFSVSKGEILGFLGPNGAGKTTTMRMITGFMAPSTGSIQVCGFDVIEQSMEARKSIGYLPETPPLYNELTVKSYLDFVGRLKGINSSKLRKERLDYVLQACWLEDVAHKLCAKLSKGYRQRVGLAQALIHNPDVIILDEPTIGLDPKQIQETRKLIKSLGGNHTVILSTHILSEVQMTCERVVIINKGQIVAEDTPQRLVSRGSGRHQVTLKVRGPAPEVQTHLQKVEGVTDVQLDQSHEGISAYTITSTREGIQEALAREIVQQSWGLIELQTLGSSLEDVFIHLINREAKEEVTI